MTRPLPRATQDVQPGRTYASSQPPSLPARIECPPVHPLRQPTHPLPEDNSQVPLVPSVSPIPSQSFRLQSSPPSRAQVLGVLEAPFGPLLPSRSLDLRSSPSSLCLASLCLCRLLVRDREKYLPFELERQTRGERRGARGPWSEDAFEARPPLRDVVIVDWDHEEARSRHYSLAAAPCCTVSNSSASPITHHPSPITHTDISDASGT
ncbi:hypothetical protein PMIN01_12788 [Paraphaeosphaeria minitans]|uniref:Uncharacterized protein n=1 Tax=Paraphaeosphaeria minitans TaxID=565426 RepID=A0A9P6KJ79_9PLEO|nr:hypothetical protein PMIN01_12788 [Paraphaeosphaeria minitans]